MSAGIVGAAGSITTGFMGAQAGNMNARELEYQAELRLQKGEYDAAQTVRKYERSRGQAIASIGTTGLALSSFVDVLADSAMEAELEVRAIKWGAGNEARNLRFQADQQRANADAAMIGGIFGALGQGIGGAAKAADYRSRSSGSGSFTVGTGPWAATVNPNFRG